MKTSILRRFFGDTLVYGFSAVLTRFLNYLLVPFFTYAFSPEDYGTIGLLYGALFLFNYLFQYGMEQAYLNYASKQNNEQSYYKTVQFGLIATSLIMAILLWWGRYWIMPWIQLDEMQHQPLFFWMICILIGDALSVVPYAALRLKRKAMVYSACKMINIIVYVILNLYFILRLDYGIEGVLMGNAIASWSVFLILLVYQFSMYKGVFNRKLYYKMLRFGIPYIPVGIGLFLNEFFGRFFLSQLSLETTQALYGSDMTPSKLLGLYNACYKMGVFMLLLVTMFRLAWQPFFLNHQHHAQAKQLFSRIFMGFNAVAAGVYIVVGLFYDVIAHIEIPFIGLSIIDSQYWQALSITPIILLAYWFYGWYINFLPGIFYKEKSRYLPIITLVCSGVTVLGNMILVPWIGIMGNAWATVLCYFTMALMLYVRSRKLYYVSYPFFRVIMILMMTFIVVYGITQTAILETLPIYQRGILAMVVMGVVVMMVGVGSLKKMIWHVKQV